METMMMQSRMEGMPVPPVAPMPPVNKPIPPMAPNPPSHDCYMPALAMAYVPMQQWRMLYEPDVAAARGTLFAELDKPFIGEEVRFV